ncbi:MAG TPA: twin-arginine translocase subunit TatC [Archaeoglobus profundus]|nr:twin-arginine translocase subunit TatC [Archaeoglobus profundus]
MHDLKPPEDKEMSLEEHLTELRKRIIRIGIVLSLGTAFIFIFGGKLMRIFWNTLLSPNMNIYALSPMEILVAQLTFSFVLVFLIFYPYIVYELYQFAKPGLYENERKFVKTFLPFSYLLFIVGLALAYFVIIPKVFYLSMALGMNAEPFLSAKKTLYTALKILVAFGLIFQIPVLAVIAVRVGLIDCNWLKEKRLIIYLAVFILATNVTLDLSGISQIIVLILVVIMYEISIILAKIMERAGRDLNPRPRD